MKFIFNLHKGMLLYGVALLLLLLWLSISFVVIAFLEKRDTESLIQYLQIEEKIHNSAFAVAKEQTTTYRLLDFIEMIDVVNSLSGFRNKTDTALNEYQEYWGDIFSSIQYTDNLRVQRSELKKISDQVDVSIRQLQAKRDAFDASIELEGLPDDALPEIPGLDDYDVLIEQLELFRYSSTYVSRYHTHKIQNLLLISDAASQLKLSNQILSALYERYLATGDDVSEGLVFHLSKVKESYAAINLAGSYTNTESQLAVLGKEYVTWHDNTYGPVINSIAETVFKKGDLDPGNYEWRHLSVKLINYSDEMLSTVGELIKEELDGTYDRVTRNIIIDIGIVFLWISFVFVAIWIYRRVYHEATHDSLTGLANRSLFISQTEKLITGDENDFFTLIKLDLSNFKIINDTVGQSIGDEILCEVASRLRREFSQSTLISRLGSDEFAILVRDLSKEEVASFAKEISDVLSAQYVLQNHTLNVKNCIGYACSPVDGKTSEALIKFADLALHEAKRTGACSICEFKSSIAEAFNERQHLETELAFALKRNEFELHYQPQVDVRKQVVDGVEALIRWRHPTRGIVSPFHFIPIAEDAGLLPSIGEWVINEASKQASIWKREHGLDLRVSVNVSAHQFVEGDVVGVILAALLREELNPENFEIEITESVAMLDLDTVVSKLNVLHKSGVRVALDDFGTGYSSLSYLQDLPLDTLKVDRSFVSTADDTMDIQHPLLESIALMAKKLKLHTVAEGVETDIQLNRVCALGIDTIQGYYYSKPVSASELPASVKMINEACSLAKAA